MTRVMNVWEENWNKLEPGTKRSLNRWEDMRPCLREMLTDPERLLHDGGEIPFREVPELGLVRSYVLVPETEEGKIPAGFLRVSEPLMQLWHVDETTLSEAASENRSRFSPPCCMPMESLMHQIRETFPEAEADSNQLSELIYVLTNREQYLGAAAMLTPGTLASLSRELESPLLYIIPSSIHEVLLIPGSAWIHPRELRSLLRHVNRTEVIEEERLCDEVFCYLGPEDRLFVAGEPRGKQTDS